MKTKIILIYSVLCNACTLLAQSDSITIIPYVLGDVRLSHNDTDSTIRIQTVGAGKGGYVEYAIAGVTFKYLPDPFTTFTFKTGIHVGEFADRNYEGQPLKRVSDLSLDVQRNNFYVHVGIDHTSNFGPNNSANWLNNLTFSDRSGDGCYYRAIQMLSGYRNQKSGTTYALAGYWDKSNGFSGGYWVETPTSDYTKVNQSVQLTATYFIATSNFIWQKKTHKVIGAVNGYTTFTKESWWYSTSVEYAYTKGFWTLGVRPQVLFGKNWFINPETERTWTFVFDATLTKRIDQNFKVFAAYRVENGKLKQNRYQIFSTGLLFALNP
jgi:hypothetical protein